MSDSPVRVLTNEPLETMVLRLPREARVLAADCPSWEATTLLVEATVKEYETNHLSIAGAVVQEVSMPARPVTQ